MNSISEGEALSPSVRRGIGIRAIVRKTGNACSIGAGAVA